MALVPDNPNYLAKLGQVLGMKKGMKEAAEYYQRALKLSPNNVAIRRNLALTQWSRRQFREARGNMEQVLAVVPDDEFTRLLLGMILVNSGEYARAVSLLESVGDRVKKMANRWSLWPGPSMSWAGGIMLAPPWNRWPSTNR